MGWDINPDAPSGGGDPGGYGMGGGAGIIGTALQVGGAIYSAHVAKRNTEKTIEANKALAEYSYSKDLEMWNRQNQYNSPEAQMARMQAAGLNPNMIYGSGSSGAAGNASQMPKYNAPTVQYNYKPIVDIPQMLAIYQDFRMRQAQIDNVKAGTELALSKIPTEAEKQDALHTSTHWKNWEGNNLKMTALEILQEQARQQPLRTQQEAKRLQLMSQEEQQRELNLRRTEQSLDLMSVEEENKAADLLFKQYRNQWMSEGITSSDNPLLRIFVRMMTESGIDPSTWLKDQGNKQFQPNLWRGKAPVPEQSAPQPQSYPNKPHFMY